MKAIEIKARTDKFGHLKINYPLKQSESDVRVIILIDEMNDDVDEEKLWLDAISSNPAFDFLNDKEEDIYSLTDGEPFSD